MYNYNVNPINIQPFMQGMEMNRRNQLEQQQQKSEQELKDLRERVLDGDEQALNELYLISPQTAAAFEARNQVSKMQPADVMGFAEDARSVYPIIASGGEYSDIALQNLYAKYEKTPFAQAIVGFAQTMQEDPDLAMQKYGEFLSRLPKSSEGKFGDWEKKVYGDTQSALGDIRKKSGVVRNSYNKITGLLDKKNLSRIDISSAITSLARLISPGIVTDKDFTSLSNSGSTAQELIAYFRGLGDDGANVADVINRTLDPTNPELFDKSAFLDTTRRLVSAEIPTILSDYQDLMDSAKRSGIGERQMDTLFGGGQSMISQLEKIAGSIKPVEDSKPNDPNELTPEEEEEYQRLKAKYGGSL